MKKCWVHACSWLICFYIVNTDMLKIVKRICGKSGKEAECWVRRCNRWKYVLPDINYRINTPGVGRRWGEVSGDEQVWWGIDRYWLVFALYLTCFFIKFIWSHLSWDSVRKVKNAGTLCLWLSLLALSNCTFVFKIAKILSSWREHSQCNLNIKLESDSIVTVSATTTSRSFVFFVGQASPATPPTASGSILPLQGRPEDFSLLEPVWKVVVLVISYITHLTYYIWWFTVNKHALSLLVHEGVLVCCRDTSRFQ